MNSYTDDDDEPTTLSTDFDDVPAGFEVVDPEDPEVDLDSVSDFTFDDGEFTAEDGEEIENETEIETEED